MRSTRKNPLPMIAVIVLFAAVLTWLVLALGNTGRASDQKQLDAVKRSVENGITMCYSIEGAYPDSIEYLTESYGVVYDSEKYIIHYECFAANVRPSVEVIERNVHS